MITDFIARWALDETSGTSSPDASGNGHDATWTSAPSWVAAQIGNGASLGANKHATFTLNLANASFSIGAWIHPTIAADMCFFSLGDSQATDQAMHCRVNSSGGIRLGFWNDDLDSGLGAITDSVWTHVVLTFSTTTKKQEIWVNGTSIANQTILSNFSGNSNGWLGGFIATGGEQWNGILDEMRVYDRVLSGTEVTDLMNWTPTAPADLPYQPHYQRAPLLAQ